MASRVSSLDRECPPEGVLPLFQPYMLGEGVGGAVPYELICIRLQLGCTQVPNPNVAT